MFVFIYFFFQGTKNMWLQMCITCHDTYNTDLNTYLKKPSPSMSRLNIPPPTTPKISKKNKKSPKSPSAPTTPKDKGGPPTSNKNLLLPLPQHMPLPGEALIESELLKFTKSSNINLLKKNWKGYYFVLLGNGKLEW